MFNINPQIQNLRRTHPYYAVSNRQKFRQKSNIKLIANDHLNTYCKNIGLQVTQITCSLIDPNIEPSPIKVRVAGSLTEGQKSAELKVFEALKLKDELNLGRRGYIKLRNTLGKDVIPSFHSVSIMEKSLDSFFQIEKNNKGWFYANPIDKIKFVCEKYLRQSNNKNIENNTFLIKISGDGTAITKSSVDLLNFTFTVINDEAKAKISKGNFSLGKLNIFKYYK